MNGFIQMLITFIPMMLLFYFLLIRPNQKRMKETQNMLDNLQVGDSVITVGRLHGVIDEIIPEQRLIVLDCEGIYLTFDRTAVMQVLSKAQPTEGTEAVDELGSNIPESKEDSE